MKLDISQRALREIHEICLYIARDDPSAAADIRTRIYEVIDHIARYPQSGHASVYRSWRATPVGRYPYVVYFHLLRKRALVRILHVVHGARRRPALRDEPAEFRAAVIS